MRRRSSPAKAAIGSSPTTFPPPAAPWVATAMSASRDRARRGILAAAIETGGRARARPAYRRSAGGSGAVSRIASDHAAPTPATAASAYQASSSRDRSHRRAVPSDAPVTIAPGQRAAIPTGIAVALPAGVEGQIRPRSDLLCAMGSPCSFCRARWMPITAARCRSSSSISARNHLPSSAASALHSSFSRLRCKQPFAKLQISMKQAAELGVLVLQVRGAEKLTPPVVQFRSNMLPFYSQPRIFPCRSCRAKAFWQSPR